MGTTPARELPVSLYWTAEWWDEAFHSTSPRPESRSRSSLEAMCLARQRFLHEELGAFGVGRERPSLQGSQIATVIRHGFDLVPVLLGTVLDFRDCWGFYPRFRSPEGAERLAPVDIGSAPEGTWILREKERLESLYGSASQCLDLGSAANNAFRILGESFYAEALADPRRLGSLLETILETMRLAYDFVSKLFGGMDPVPVSNCNVSLLGPATYAEVILPFDAAQNRFGTSAAVHHCDVRAEPFLPAYARLPRVSSIQASFDTDPEAVRAAIPGAELSAIVSPGALNGDLGLLRDKFNRAVGGGARDLAIWNIDTRTSCARMREILSLIREVARSCDRHARFEGMPLCWEEIEWAHARYRPEPWSRDFA